MTNEQSTSTSTPAQTQTRTILWAAGTITARTQAPSIYLEVETVDEPAVTMTPDFVADLAGLCYCLGMPSFDPQTEQEDGVDFLMRSVATCLNWLESK